MGIFYEQTILVNRSPVDLTVTFDGQAKTLKPGDNVVPKAVVEFAKNQNPIMGSQDPNNPHISGASYLVGEKDSADDVSILTPEAWQAHLGRPCRIDEEAAFAERYGGDPKAKMVVHGKGRKSTANSRYEAGGAAGASATEFTGRE